MKIFKTILVITAIMLTGISLKAQKNFSRTETFRVFGNCGSCKAKIEKAGNKKHAALVSWDSNTQTAVVSYDPAKQTSDEILKRIAYAGYDNEKYLAPDDAYESLPGCCKYTRSDKASHPQNAAVSGSGGTNTATVQSSGQLNAVFSSYFDLKDALVKSDAKSAAAKAAELATSVGKVDISKLSNDQHTAWMKVEKKLLATAKEISGLNDIDKQRLSFAGIAADLAPLARVAGLGFPVFLQHCPMYNNGSDWLSKEITIRNPYYGSEMLSCGKTVETIK